MDLAHSCEHWCPILGQPLWSDSILPSSLADSPYLSSCLTGRLNRRGTPQFSFGNFSGRRDSAP